MERRDGRQGALLRSWLETRVVPAFAERILPVDAAVVTRNTADFEASGVRLLNPWR